MREKKGNSFGTDSINSFGTDSIILKNLKIKNCEGFDRIPLRIFNEGAELLAKPLASLFKLI